MYKGLIISSTIFNLKNEKYRSYLFASKQYEFTTMNCGRGCPIKGQLEVSAQSYDDKNTKLKVHSGLFFDIKEKKGKSDKWVYEEGEEAIEDEEDIESDL